MSSVFSKTAALAALVQLYRKTPRSQLSTRQHRSVMRVTSYCRLTCNCVVAIYASQLSSEYKYSCITARYYMVKSVYTRDIKLLSCCSGGVACLINIVGSMGRGLSLQRTSSCIQLRSFQLLFQLFFSCFAMCMSLFYAEVQSSKNVCRCVWRVSSLIFGR